MLKSVKDTHIAAFLKGEHKVEFWKRRNDAEIWILCRDCDYARRL